jgi:phage terminase small subunit
MGSHLNDDYLDKLVELEQNTQVFEAGGTSGAEQTAVPIRRKSVRELTSSQLAFAQELIKGNTLKGSYRVAYPNTTCADATATSNGHKLSRDPRIAKLVNEGNEENVEHLAESVEGMRRYVLRSLIAQSKDSRQEGSRLKALELLARSIGMFKENDSAKDKAQTPDQLKRELASHLKLLNNVKPIKSSTGI